MAHPYSAVTRVMARLYPNCSFVQIHGFDQKERRTETGVSADLIISSGTDFPEQPARKIALLMQTRFPYARARLFPLEVEELGATTNVQGELLRQLGSNRFIHLEMSQPLRRRLMTDAAARQLFLKNLAEGVD
jgi:hypothetical protein